MNAIVHGLRSKKIARAQEDGYAFENRRHKWLARADARDDCEEFLVYLSVCQSFSIENAQRAQVERVSNLIENYDEDQLDEVYRLGKRLFHDPAGPTPLYGIKPYFLANRKKTSGNGEAVDSNAPELLVRALEKSLLGCNWLRFRWLELRKRAETGVWQGADRLKAVRLLGKQPIAALEDQRVATIFVAAEAIYSNHGCVFGDLAGEMRSDQLGTYENAVFTQWPDLQEIENEAEGREALIELANEEIEHLDELLKAHALNVDAVSERALDRLRQDETPTGKSIREYQSKSTSAFYRGLEARRRYKRENDHERVTREEVSTRQTRQGQRAADPAWQNADAARLPASDAGVHDHCTDIQINYANEAKFIENVIVSENNKPIDVTADFGPDLGLDTEKDESTNPKLEIRNPKLEGLNPKPEIRNPKLEDLNPKPEIRNLKLEDLNPNLEIRNPKLEVADSKLELANRRLEALDSQSEIRSREPETRGPDSELGDMAAGKASSAPAAGDLGDSSSRRRMRRASAKRERRRARREKVMKELEGRRGNGVEPKVGEGFLGRSIGEVLESPPNSPAMLRTRLPRSP